MPSLSRLTIDSVSAAPRSDKMAICPGCKPSPSSLLISSAILSGTELRLGHGLTVTAFVSGTLANTSVIGLAPDIAFCQSQDRSGQR